MQAWLAGQGVTSAFVEPGSPQQAAFIERFNGTMRRECLNVEELDSVLEARVVIGEWVELYSTVRRHRGLGGKTPAAFDAEWRNLATTPKTRQTRGARSESRT